MYTTATRNLPSLQNLPFKQSDQPYTTEEIQRGIAVRPPAINRKFRPRPSLRWTASCFFLAVWESTVYQPYFIDKLSARLWKSCAKTHTTSWCAFPFSPLFREQKSTFTRELYKSKHQNSIQTSQNPHSPLKALTLTLIIYFTHAHAREPVGIHLHLPLQHLLTWPKKHSFLPLTSNYLLCLKKNASTKPKPGYQKPHKPHEAITRNRTYHFSSPENRS